MPSLLSNHLRELGAALGTLDAFTTADCGVMHLASAAGTQTIGLFKVTDPVRYGPYGHGSAAIVAPDSAPEAAVREVVAQLRQAPASGSTTP
jgi:ADP-heptose:LPS heptosyltransferase